MFYHFIFHDFSAPTCRASMAHLWAASEQSTMKCPVAEQHAHSELIFLKKMELPFDMKKNDLLKPLLKAYMKPLSALSSGIVVSKEHKYMHTLSSEHVLAVKSNLSPTLLKTYHAITAVNKCFGCLSNQTMVAVLNSLNTLILKTECACALSAYWNANMIHRKSQGSVWPLKTLTSSFIWVSA